MGRESLGSPRSEAMASSALGASPFDRLLSSSSFNFVYEGAATTGSGWGLEAHEKSRAAPARRASALRGCLKG